MNGFTHAILSLMLSWIRALISNVWALITSEDGGLLYQFLSRHWLELVLWLCAAGIAADLIIYFFRWRPDYVWKSRLRRLRRAKTAEPMMDEEAVPAPPPFQPAPEPAAYAPLQQPTMVYEPQAQPTRFYPPVQDDLDEPVFDDEDALWDEAREPVQTDWDRDELPAFGASKPEPIAHYHDIQAGFAPPVAPEQLYTPSPSYQAPVHPGLDEDAVRQSFRLNEDEDFQQEHAAPVMYAPAFKPFTVVEDAPAKAENPFARFAKRARTLVGIADEDNGPTIHDLQSTVDVSQAFHAPVYPQPLNHHKEG